MKLKLLLFAAALLISAFSYAQTGVAINATGAEADNSAMLDVSAINKGILAPRMTALQRTGISNPVKGLLVYQNDGTEGFYYFDGAAWTRLANGTYTETDPVFGVSAAKGITPTNITNWNTSFGWGNHAGLYRPISYVPAWSEITSNPFSFSSAANNQLLRYNSTSAKWENWTHDFLTANTGITGATNTKITYDSKGLVTAGAAATTADIPASADKNYVTNAQQTVLTNTSGINTGDNATNTQYSGLDAAKANLSGAAFTGAISATNLSGTNTGDQTNVTGSAASFTGSLAGDVTGLQGATVVGKINGASMADLATGILKNTTSTGIPSIAVAADFPTLNQNTTGTAGNITGTVAIANGGTGSTTQNFVDLTTAQTVAGNKTFSGDITAKRYVLTQPSAIPSAATTTIDLSLGNVFQVNLGTNITTLSLTNPAVGTYLVKFTQDATGSRTVAFPAGWKWSGGAAPTVTGTESKTDIVTLIYDGTTYYAAIVQNF
ncbi:MAG: hypothetical protein NT004_10360 [Bacteroidetes bacterium]|nr:hypothetical protein [Bacteroidota bacterium]